MTDPPAFPGDEVPANCLRVSVPGAAAMRDLGARLASLLRPGDLVVLSGSLGAGKTTLVQGIATGLDVRGPITSPTFVIARVHPSLRGGPDLVHADAYRLNSQLEVDDLDLDADVDHSVTVVEWGEGLVEGLTTGHLHLCIDWAERGRHTLAADATADEPRIVAVAGRGDRWSDVASLLAQALGSGAESGIQLF